MVAEHVCVKICGLTTPAAIDTAIDAGADAIGLVLSPSPRRLDAAKAKKLIEGLPPSIASVVVTRQPPADFVDTVLTELAPSWWQSDLGDLTNQTLPAGTRALPVIRVGDDVSMLPPLFVYEGKQSGQGETVDWVQAAALARRGRLILAGGLCPGNVGRAIHQVKPYGVDVSSGVESAPGVKDPRRIREFIAAVRRAELQQ